MSEEAVITNFKQESPGLRCIELVETRNTCAEPVEALNIKH
jgi:hypothetical protein